MNSKAVSIDPEVMHGTPVFRGTRVPVEALFDYLQTESTVDEFVFDFPTVQKAVVMEFLDSLKEEFAFDENRFAGRKHSPAIEAPAKEIRGSHGSRNGLGQDKKRKAS